MKLMDALLTHGPLAIDRQVLERLAQAEPGASLGLGSSRRVSARRNGSAAIIEVYGLIAPRSSWILSFLGGTSLEQLRANVDAALTDASVERIVLDIDSPGGPVAGVSDFAGYIKASRTQKPIVAYSGGYMASAAYWIGSAAGEVVASPTATIGSIGVVAVVADDRGRQQRDGVVLHEIVSSGAPYKRPDPATKDGRAAVQAQVDALEAVFVQQVAQQRGVTEKRVRSDFGQGGVLIGAAAVTAGLANRVGTIESAMTPGKSKPLEWDSPELPYRPGQQRKANWDQDPVLRAEFGTFERYDAYARNEERQLENETRKRALREQYK